MIPLEILKECREKKICVHTSEQDLYTGILEDFDLYVNISLKNAEFNECETNETNFIGDTIIQGTRITFIEILNE